jgi:hypothetical protein
LVSHLHLAHQPQFPLVGFDVPLSHLQRSWTSSTEPVAAEPGATFAVGSYARWSPSRVSIGEEIRPADTSLR